MTPSTVALIAIVISILQFLGSMLYFSSKFGEYKNKVDTGAGDVRDTKQSVKSLHERFDAFYKAMMGYENRLGRAEGQLERINGKGH